MKNDLVLVCNKCEHNLYITDGANFTGKQIMKKLQNLDCPNCGEESGEYWKGLWSITRLGNYDKEVA